MENEELPRTSLETFDPQSMLNNLLMKEEFAMTDNIEPTNTDSFKRSLEDIEHNNMAKKKRKKLFDVETNLENALQCIQSMRYNIEKRDEYSVFGEYIAQQIRTCNKSKKEIAIAQHQIENVIFNLIMGNKDKAESSSNHETNQSNPENVKAEPTT